LAIPPENELVLVCEQPGFARILYEVGSVGIAVLICLRISPNHVLPLQRAQSEAYGDVSEAGFVEVVLDLPSRDSLLTDEGVLHHGYKSHDFVRGKALGVLDRRQFRCLANLLPLPKDRLDPFGDRLLEAGEVLRCLGLVGDDLAMLEVGSEGV
jgi:hypothetical protein